MPRLDELARAAAAASRGGGGTGGPDAMGPMGGMPDLPPEAETGEGGGGEDVESALASIEAALDALGPDEAEKGRAHIEALRAMLGGAGEASAEELPEDLTSGAPAPEPTAGM